MIDAFSRPIFIPVTRELLGDRLLWCRHCKCRPRWKSSDWCAGCIDDVCCERWLGLCVHAGASLPKALRPAPSPSFPSPLLIDQKFFPPGRPLYGPPLWGRGGNLCSYRTSVRGVGGPLVAHRSGPVSRSLSST